MKLSDLGLITILLLTIVGVVYLEKKKENSYAIKIYNDSVLIDSIPTSECYQKTIVIRHNDYIGTNPRLNHKVKCDYNKYENNWDEDLHIIK